MRLGVNAFSTWFVQINSDSLIAARKAELYIYLKHFGTKTPVILLPDCQLSAALD
jgi:hypothetical protein